MTRCITCGLYRQFPRPVWDSLKHYYPENYVAYNYKTPHKKSIQGFINQYGNLKRRRAIEKFQLGGQLLEVGCGTGSFLSEMQNTNRWTCVGIEPNVVAAAHVQKTLKIPVHHERFSDIQLTQASFDVVVMWCVLEHLEYPISDIQKAHSLLKNGGWFVFTIPNFESLEKKIFGEFWSGWDLPRHLYIFPKPVLHDILEKNGFQVVTKKCLASSYHVLRHSLDFWSQTWENKFPTTKKLLMKSYSSWLVRLGLVTPLAIVDRLNLSTNITIVAQKIRE